MKKILLLSDTHSHVDDTILKYVAQADEVWHAGDIGEAFEPAEGAPGGIEQRGMARDIRDIRLQEGEAAARGLDRRAGFGRAFLGDVLDAAVLRGAGGQPGACRSELRASGAGD